MSDEKILKTVNSNDLKNKEVKSNLILKFRKSFTYPMCLAISFNIIITIFFLFNFSKKLSRNEDLTEIINKSENDRNLPIIENVGNILYKKFQSSIFSLFSFKKYIQQITKEDFLDLKDSSFYKNFTKSRREDIENFIDKYSHNINAKKQDYSNFFDKYIKKNLYERITWFLNPKKLYLSDLSDEELRSLYLITNLNLLFKSHFELSKTSNFTGLSKIYGGFSKTGIYFAYPPFNKSNWNETNYQYFLNFTNPSDCRDDQLNIPKYFYFKCRPWYKETIELNRKNNFTVAITYPYTFISNTVFIGISSCIKINDNDIFNDISTTADPNNFFIICVDMPLSDIISVFDYLNNMINGYFFVMRIDSDKPIYYPQLQNNLKLENLARYEFDSSTIYYIDDLIDFKQKFRNELSKRYDINYSQLNQTGMSLKVMKNGSNYNYRIHPISLNFGEFFEKEFPLKDIINLINVIYVTPENMYQDTIKIIQSSMTAKIIFTVIVIVILGFIVLLISFYLINSIAINILRPIKMMNSILIGINRHSNPEDSTDLKKCILKNNLTNFKNYQKLNEDDNDYENEDDDLLDIRSEDIDLLFQTLIDLKKTLNYVQTDRFHENEYKMLNLLFAKSTFNCVNNKAAGFLCNSNIGNLALKFRKYDKAIIHLWEAIKLNDKYIVINENEKYCELLKDFIYNNDEKNGYIFNYCNVALFPTNSIENKKHIINSIQLELDKKINLESRIPKLIFAYKKFFKNIHKCIKTVINDEKLVNLNFGKNLIQNVYGKVSNREFYYINRPLLIANFIEKDIFSKQNYHNLTNFKIVIDQYIEQAKEAKNIRIQILAEFEFIEFLIKYLLKPLEYNYEYIKNHIFSFENIDRNLIVNNNMDYHIEQKQEHLRNIFEVRKHKLNYLRDELKKEIDQTNLNITNDNKDTTEKYLISKKLSKKNYLEYSDLPKCVLVQRINFLAGKFYFKIDLRETFMRLNSISKCSDDVIDGVILRSSYKKLKKVFFTIIQILQYYQTEKNESEERKKIKEDLEKEREIKNLKNYDSKKSGDIMLINEYTAIKFLEDMTKKCKICINDYEEEMSKFSITSKDIAVILDYSFKTMKEQKKREKAQKFFEHIFQNLCTFNDRIALYGYNESPFQLLSLIHKNNKTIKLIENHYKELFKKDDVYFKESKEEEKEHEYEKYHTNSELINAIYYVYNNIGKKDVYNKREKWIIVLTDNINVDDYKVFTDGNFSKKVYGNKKNENLVIVRFKYDEKEEIVKTMEEVLNFNKSCYIELDKKHEIKSKMRVQGTLNESSIFDSEIYNP